jgi:glycosyltransferase involved in cell wall biosynthesis
MIDHPTVSVIVPTYNEEQHLTATLESVLAQTYPEIEEIIVADGRSSDRTREIATRFPGVRVIDNPRRIQAAGLNCALAEATGEFVVRVDGHCVLDADYVEQCVGALMDVGAAMVGGAMSPHAAGPRQRGIAAAMSSRLGAGPARFHVGGPPGWVETVYLGAFRLDDARALGGYAEDVGVNEDAEFAIRMSSRGGIWFDPRIRSSYSPRESYRALLRQFHRYGRSRATTVRRHPRSIKLRQLAAPALVVGLLSRRRRAVGMAYASVVAARAAYELARDPEAAPAFALALPVMHLSWGVGFLQGIARAAALSASPKDPQTATTRTQSATSVCR